MNEKITPALLVFDFVQIVYDRLDAQGYTNIAGLALLSPFQQLLEQFKTELEVNIPSTKEQPDGPQW